jgi:uncharacterized phage protein (TIGR01671 family)
MEDRYLFKAKELDDGEWVQGYCVKGLDAFENCEEAHIIFEPNTMFYSSGETDGWYKVDPTTICQCTGLKDKNGKLIWENDIVSFEDTGEEGYEYKEGFDFINKAMVEFAEGRWSLTDFASDNSGVMDEMYDHAEFMEFWQCCEVIGNKFDNPELLGRNDE